MRSPRRIALVAVVVAACGKAASDRAGRELGALDPAEASVRVRALVDSCVGLERALDQLSASGFGGRVLTGLVDDAVDASRAPCPRPAIRGGTSVHRLARARLIDERPAEAYRILGGDGVTPTTAIDPQLRLRRAELLDRLGRPADALAELSAVHTGGYVDPRDATLRRALELSAAVRAGQAEAAAKLIAAAPLPEQPALAYRAATDAPAELLEPLARASSSSSPELVAAVADRIERERGPAAALGARELAAAAAPDRAEPQDALARARLAAAKIDEAVAAWDRAIALAPAQPAYRLAAIEALVAADALASLPALPEASPWYRTARLRVDALAAEALHGDDVELVHTASLAAATLGDHTLALALAREAQHRRPGDGRFAFAIAERLAEAGDRAAAATAFADLLACGAHGRPWHRHEVAAKLVGLATDAASRELVASALAATRACAVDQADLATYVETARERLR